MHCNHLKTIPALPQSMEKLSSTKPVPGAKKVREHGLGHILAQIQTSLLCNKEFSYLCPQLWRRQWHPTPVLLPGKSHGQRSLVGSSPWGLQESDTTEWLHFQFSLSCIGEGNDNPLRCSCLESPRDWGAWWAAIYGIAQSLHDWSDLTAAAAAWVTASKLSEFLESWECLFYSYKYLWSHLLTW